MCTVENEAGTEVIEFGLRVSITRNEQDDYSH
jgi:hypothetical protein